jgi:hypothetical protein
MGSTIGVQFPAGARYLRLLDTVQTSSEIYPASYPMGTAGRDVKLTTHLLPLTRSRIVELYLHLPQVFMV